MIVLPVLVTSETEPSQRTRELPADIQAAAPPLGSITDERFADPDVHAEGAAA
jgi:hypothetical protein